MRNIKVESKSTKLISILSQTLAGKMNLARIKSSLDCLSVRSARCKPSVSAGWQPSLKHLLNQLSPCACDTKICRYFFVEKDKKAPPIWAGQGCKKNKQAQTSSSVPMSLLISFIARLNVAFSSGLRNALFPFFIFPFIFE